MNTVQDALDKYLSTGFIYDFNLDVTVHALSFNLYIISDQGRKDHKVVISEIYFFVFSDSYPKTISLENTQIYNLIYQPKKIKAHTVIASYKGKEFDIDYNLHLKLKNTDLLIHAGKLKINEEKFNLA